MSDKYLADLLRYRIAQSYETLNESKILFEKKSYRGCVNRAYYAMFYALLALLATKKIGTSKHSGVISFFDKEFVKNGEFGKEMSKKIRTAFNRRQNSDYGEMFEIDIETAKQSIDDAERFIIEIDKYLQKNHGLLQ